MSEFITTSDPIYTWADLTPEPVSENVYLARRYHFAHVSAVSEAWRIFSEAADWMPAEGMYRELDDLYNQAMQAEEQLLEAIGLAESVILGDRECLPDMSACSFCRALDVMKKYLEEQK
jgi:hypothetical protein